MSTDDAAARLVRQQFEYQSTGRHAEAAAQFATAGLPAGAGSPESGTRAAHRRWPRGITSPGGFESYYHDPAAATSPAQAMAVQAEYGITFHGDLAAELISRHGLHAGDIPQQWP